MKSHYEILGINNTATQEQIKVAYRKLAKKNHPDLFQENGSTDLMQKINEAYEILNNPKERKKYDLSIEPKENKEIFNTKIFDFIKNSQTILNDSILGQNISPKNYGKIKIKGNKITIHVDKSKIINNKLSISYPTNVRCSYCNGDGVLNKFRCNKCKGNGKLFKITNTGDLQDCPECGGVGYMGNECPQCNGYGIDQSNIYPKEYEFILKNSDITTGYALYENAGHFIKGGSEGDIELLITKQLEIEQQALIPIYNMYFGGYVEIDTMTGLKKIKIEPKTQSGKKIRLKSAGKNGENIKIGRAHV